MTPIVCARCCQPVTSFAGWFSEACPQENPADMDYGHKLSRLDLLALVCRPKIERVKQEEATP